MTKDRARDANGMTRDANGTNLNGHSGALLHLLPTYRVQNDASGMNRDVNGTHRDRHANGTNLNGAPLHPLPAFRALPEVTLPKGKVTARCTEQTPHSMLRNCGVTFTKNMAIARIGVLTTRTALVDRLPNDPASGVNRAKPMVTPPTLVTSALPALMTKAKGHRSKVRAKARRGIPATGIGRARISQPGTPPTKSHPRYMTHPPLNQHHKCHGGMKTN